MVKVWFSVLIYKTFKSFMEAVEYTLVEVTITRLKCLHQSFFQKFDQGLSRSGKKFKNQLQLVIIFRGF